MNFSFERVRRRRGREPQGEMDRSWGLLIGCSCGDFDITLILGTTAFISSVDKVQPNANSHPIALRPQNAADE